jgi:hypothetical protein
MCGGQPQSFLRKALRFVYPIILTPETRGHVCQKFHHSTVSKELVYFVNACCRGSTATFFNQFLSPLQNRYKTLVINVSLFLTFIQKQKELKKNRELNRELRNFR